MVNSQNLKTSVSFVGDGTTTNFYFGFDYINKQFVKVTVGAEGNTLDSTDYTVEDRQVKLKEAPKEGVAIRVFRQTPTEHIVEWADGAFIKASQMNLETLQQLHLIEEAQDYPIINGISRYPDGVNFNALGAKIINVKNPENPQDVVTKDYMENVQGGFVRRNSDILEETKRVGGQVQDDKNLSKAWAVSENSPDNADDPLSPTGKTNSSRSWALWSYEAEQSARNAEDNARISALRAETSEQQAKTSATNASTSEQNAKNSETQAKSAEMASNTFASRASEAATNAKSSETNASTSEGKSLEYSKNAYIYMQNAQISEKNAAQSAKEASESAGVFSDFKGATETTDGGSGKVPKPTKGQQGKFLKGDGTWGDVPNPDLSGYVKSSEVGNSANKIPRFNSSGHLVFPNGAEMWVN